VSLGFVQLINRLTTASFLRNSKNDTVRELVLHLSHELSLPTSPIAGALPEIQARLRDNNSSLEYLSPEQSPVPGVIRFKRYVQARWDQPTKRFIPLEVAKWVWEGMVLVIVEAGEVVDRIATGHEGLGLGDWISDVKLSLGIGEGRKDGDGLILIIKGMGKYYSKLKTVANREFTAAARAGLGEKSGGRGSEKGLGSGPEKEDVERGLVELQLQHGCFVVHGQFKSIMERRMLMNGGSGED
jgi:crossover junction endonuclease EME1